MTGGPRADGSELSSDVGVRWRFAIDGQQRAPDELATMVRSSLQEHSQNTTFVEVNHEPHCFVVVGEAARVERAIAERRGNGEKLAIIALVRHVDRDASPRLFDAGADDCIVDPCDPRELRARLRAVLRRTHGTSPARAGLELDPSTLRIRVHDVVATVSRRQFDIFSYLARHLEQWVSSDEIIAHACGTCHDPYTSLVRVHIHKLRKALDVRSSCIRCDRHRNYMLTLTS